ncbi:hypothetical protein [Solidesulfovibrio sp.]
MEKLLICRDRQEFQAHDLNSVQLYTDDALSNIVMDAITTERMFVGLAVVKRSATEMDIDVGRLWDGRTGKRYAKRQAETVSLFSYLPVTDQRYLNISVIGQEVDTDQEPRDFLVDLASGATEPKSVYMTTSRVVAIQITPGLESTSPQKPAEPTSYTTIAYVLLGTSGIIDIELAANKELMRLHDVYQKQLTLAAWIAAAAPKLASLMSDLASLAALVKGLKTSGLVMQLAAEVALIRDKLELPDTYSEYDADNLLTTAGSDTANPEFFAYVYMGARFPWAGETEQQLDLFNPYDTDVKNAVGMVLPAYDEVARLSLSGYAGALALSQYQYQTVTTRQCTRTRVRTEYSPTWRWCTNGVNWGNVAEGDVIESVFEGEVPAGVTIGDTRYRETWTEDNRPGHEIMQSRDVWVHVWQENYTIIDSVTESINGSVTAQTILNSQNGWLTKVGLNFTTKGADGAVTMYLMDTINGLPNHDRVIGRATVAAADIKLTPTETLFEFVQPVFLASGRRYAIVLVTGGAHSVSLVKGTEYSQGTLFHSTDGEYYQGDFTQDLQMTLYYAQFKNPRTVVDLTPVSLANGIAVFDILHERIQPAATSLTLEYQPSGSGEWVAITEGTTDKLLGLPAMCRLRAVFNGTRDIMPCLGLSGSKLRAKRPGTSFRHISTERALTSASDDISVIVRLENWDATKHTCTVKLVSGGSLLTGTATDETLDATTIRRTVRFTPALPISAYKIQIEGTTTTPLTTFHVAQRMDVAL